MAFGPNGRYLATASDDTARVWELRGSRQLTQLVHDDVVEDVASSPDGRYLATAGRDGTARLWKPTAHDQ